MSKEEPKLTTIQRIYWEKMKEKLNNQINPPKKEKVVGLTRIEREAKIRNLLRLFLDSVRDYEGECGSAITYDERDSEEFVDIFLDSEDAFDFWKLIEQPAPGESCRVERVNHPLDPEEWSCDCYEAINGDPCRIKNPNLFLK